MLHSVLEMSVLDYAPFPFRRRAFICFIHICPNDWAIHHQMVLTESLLATMPSSSHNACNQIEFETLDQCMV